MSRNLSDEHKRAWISFLVSHAVLTRKIDRILVENGLPTLDIYDVLLALEDSPDHRLRMSELADRVLLSRSGVTRLVDRLEKEGYVERHACKADRRSLWAILTPKGLEVRQRTWPVYQQAICDLFADKVECEEACAMAKALLRTVQDDSGYVLHGMPQPIENGDAPR